MKRRITKSLNLVQKVFNLIRLKTRPITVILAATTILFINCSSAKKPLQVTNEYTPKFQEYWQEVDSAIQYSWMTCYMPAQEGLPNPYLAIAPGWSQMYYWDTYFMNAGMFYHDNVKDITKGNVDNLLYAVENMGYVPNCSRSWGLNRSQPPYLSHMVREVYEHMATKDTVWLKQSYYTLLKEYDFWMDDTENAIEENTTPVEGLQRYFHHATFSEQVDLYNQIAFRFEWDKTIPDSAKAKIAIPYLAESEAGVDFTPRFENRCHEFVAIDLNANLYSYENNFEWMEKELNISSNNKWNEKADLRKERLNKYCWSEERGLFMDYDFVNKRHSSIAAITSFMPLFNGLATKEQAKKTLDNLNVFEYEWGITPCEKTDLKSIYQWDYPTAWTPGPYMLVYSLDKYGYKTEAKRIAAKYLDLITNNYLNPLPLKYKKHNGEEKTREKGKLYEKYNAVTGQVFDIEYGAPEFMGWTAGVYTYLYNYLKESKD